MKRRIRQTKAVLLQELREARTDVALAEDRANVMSQLVEEKTQQIAALIDENQRLLEAMRRTDARAEAAIAAARSKTPYGDFETATYQGYEIPSRPASVSQKCRTWWTRILGL